MGKCDYQCKTPGKISSIQNTLPQEPSEGRRRSAVVALETVSAVESSIEVFENRSSKKQKTDLKEVNRELRSSVESGLIRVCTLEHDLHVADSKIKCQQEEFASSQREVTSLKSSVESGLDRIHIFKEKLFIARRDVEVAQEELASSQREVADCYDRLSHLERHVRDTEGQLQAAKDHRTAEDGMAEYYQSRLSNIRSQINEYISDDPFAAANFLILELRKKNVGDDEVVSGFMRALTWTKTLKKQAVAFLTAQENHIAGLESYFGGLMYKGLQEKFKPWVCLRELDLVATVSFQGYEIIRRIEFHKEENCKYMRGLFKNRQTLSRLSALLEAHSRSILPYTISENAIQFDVKTAVKWLLEK
jgi:hypothetical protein